MFRFLEQKHAHKNKPAPLSSEEIEARTKKYLAEQLLDYSERAQAAFDRLVKEHSIQGMSCEFFSSTEGNKLTTFSDHRGSWSVAPSYFTRLSVRVDGKEYNYECDFPNSAYLFDFAEQVHDAHMEKEFIRKVFGDLD